MNKPVTIDAIAERLQAIAEDADNPQISAQARRLMSRLKSPVRLVLLGFPGTGKLDLLNALIDGAPLPAAANDVTVELRFGKTESVQITRSDGSVTERDGVPEDADFSDAAFVVVARPLPVLRQVSILNIVAASDADEQHAAISWAASRIDIALWCSHRFGPYDREVWARVPEGIKDHAFLVLTGCDPEKASEVKSRHRDEFVDVYSIDVTAVGLKATDTGVAELADRIANHAQLGRRADLDGAMLFLKSQSGASAAVSAKPVVQKAKAEKPAPDQKPRQEAKPAATEAASPEDDALAPVPAALFEQGIGYVRDRADALLSTLRRSETVDGATLIGECRETLTQLGDIVTNHDEGGNPSVAWLGDAVMEAESLVILLENERSDDAVVDAVSLLLQIRRDFEMRQAA